MKRLAQGNIHERISAIPNAWYPAYIIRGDGKNMMIDAGVNLLGPQYLASINETIGDTRLLHYLFLTHSHYDHIGSASYMKQQYLIWNKDSVTEETIFHDIFLLSDGAVENTEAVIQMARKNSKNARISSIGIGNGASSRLIEGTA